MQILATGDKDYAAKLAEFRAEQSEKGMEHREWSPGEGAGKSFGFQAN
jgi:hypothetical protein